MSAGSAGGVQYAVDSLVAEGRPDQAIGLARTALAEDDLTPATAARVRLTVSSVLLMKGQPEAALAEAEIVLSVAGLTQETYAAAQLARLMGLMASGEFSGAQGPAEAILAGGASSDTNASLAGALATIGAVAWTQGRVGDSISFLRAAVARCHRGPEAARRMHPRQSLVVPLVAIGEFDQAADLLRDDAEEIRAFGEEAWAIGVVTRRSRLHLASGQVTEAKAEAERAIAMADALGARLFVPLARTTLAFAALHRGDLHEAISQLKRCESEPAALRGGPIVAMTAWIRARVAYSLDGPERAADLLTDVYDNLTPAKRMLLEEPASAPWFVRVALAAHHRERAEVVAVVCDQLAAENPDYPSVLAIALHARGVLQRDTLYLTQAVADHAHPWARASAAEDLGAVLADQGDMSGARTWFDLALSTYTEAGAVHDASRVQRRSHDLTAATSRSGRPMTGWASLTDTQRAVAELVAQGLTNTKVAAALYRSRHTVDFHLRQIFLKLGINSRVELTRLVLKHAD
jgi:DNA-binding CsgD family transcriptional regulator